MRREACGVWRVACGVWRVACGGAAMLCARSPAGRLSRGCGDALSSAAVLAAVQLTALPVELGWAAALPRPVGRLHARATVFTEAFTFTCKGKKRNTSDTHTHVHLII